MLHIVNATDSKWTSHRYILSFGAYGSTNLLIWANGLESALDEAIDWLVKNAPGHIVDDQVTEAYNEAIAEGKSEDEAWAYSEEDTTCGGNCGNHILSYEWSMIEDPDRATILRLRDE